MLCHKSNVENALNLSNTVKRGWCKKDGVGWYVYSRRNGWGKRVRIIKLRQEKKMKILLLLVNMPSFGNKPLCTWIVLSGFISVIIIEKDEPIVIYTYTSRS